MCIALPVKIALLRNKKIIIRDDGGKREIRCSLIKVKTGDYVILQNNFIIGKVGKKEAKEILNLTKNKL